MQIVIVLAAIIAVTLSAAVEDPRAATILRSNNDIGADTYKYS